MTSNLRVQELDFDTIKGNLKDFLRNKPEFSDYDFEGSGMSALLNILAYNTHYTAILANMQMGELFLDTASKRTTAALHASRLGYIPKSITAPTAKVKLEIFPNDEPSTVTIGRGATFSTTISGNEFTYVTTEAQTIQRSSQGRYVFESIDIKEGTFKTFRYIKTPDKNKFTIPSKNVDINTISVKVQTSETNTSTTTFLYSKSLVDVNSKSFVYFLRLNQQGFYEIYFGDSVLSRNIDDGNIVIVEYLESNGDLSNGASIFSFTDTVQGYSSNLVTTLMSANGGSVEETAEEIKINAMAAVGVQNRAVTLTDYKSVIKEVYPVESVAVWGGDQNEPPIYGKVFISIKPISGADVLTDTTKEYIKQELIKKKNILTVTPVIVDPSFVNVIVNSTVYFNDILTNYAANTISTLVKESIMNYGSLNLGKFENILRFTKLCSEIDKTDESILSNITNIKLRKTALTSTLAKNGLIISFGNPINPGMTSGSFFIDGISTPMFISDADGVLTIFYYDGVVKKIYKQAAGRVDYNKGVIYVDRISSAWNSNDAISFTVVPKSNDVFSIRENILLLDSNDVTVTTLVENNDSTKHIFTASR